MASIYDLKPAFQRFLHPWVKWLAKHHVTANQVTIAAAVMSFVSGLLILLFPEGSRGEPEKLSEFKKGIVHLAEHYPQVPVVPVFMYGLGKALPKGELILVPFFCDVLIGDAIYWQGDKELFTKSLNEHFKILIEEYTQEPGQSIS